MERKEYCRRVMDALPRLTGDEKSDVWRELDGHMEDHMTALMEAGYDEALAAERAVDAMGDPEAMGRELNRQYPPFWLWVNRAAILLIALTVLTSSFGLAMISALYDSLRARIAPYGITELADWERVSEKRTIGNDVVWVYGVEGYRPGQGGQVSVRVSIYDRFPGGTVFQNLDSYLYACNQRGEEFHWGGGGSSEGYASTTYDVTLSPEDTYIIMRYQRFGETVELTVPLPEVTS